MDMWATERSKAVIYECGLKVLMTEYDTLTIKNPYRLIVWKPKAIKPFIHYVFPSIEARQKYLDEVIKRFESSQAQKMIWKLERQGIGVNISQAVKVGDIFNCSWGYDQTNQDYYQVIAINKRTVTIREIASQHIDKSTGNNMAAYVVPVKDSFVGEPMKKLMQFSDGKPYLTITSYSSASLWDGKPDYCSWYA